MRSEEYRFGFYKEVEAEKSWGKKVWIWLSPWNNKYQGKKKMEVRFKIRNKSIKGCQQLEVSDSEYFKIMTLFLLEKRNRNVGFVQIMDLLLVRWRSRKMLGIKQTLDLV